MNEVVKLERHDVVAIVTVNSPPVNALSAAVRGGILECMQGAIADPQVKAIVLTCGISATAREAILMPILREIDRQKPVRPRRSPRAATDPLTASTW